ncbi:MAG: phosphate ABC transporter ATP-binding protein [Pseudomonadota bacterium]
MLNATKTANTQSTRTNAPLMTVDQVDFWYGEKQALFDVSLEIYRGEIIAFMGPSGCGKSTLLKLLNRMQDDAPGARFEGRIELDGDDIYAPDIDPVTVRRRFGWVAQAPNPFPKSVHENIAYGPRIHSLIDGHAQEDALVESCLKRARLWDELKDRLDEPGTSLSGGQQQRLCIARALSISPDILLLDEPCSAIDPTATSAIEDLLLSLKHEAAIVIITHNLEQARRLADRVAFFHLGKLIEYGPADQVFSAPRHDVTKGYLTGVFG